MRGRGNFSPRAPNARRNYINCNVFGWSTPYKMYQGGAQTGSSGRGPSRVVSAGSPLNPAPKSPFSSLARGVLQKYIIRVEPSRMFHTSPGESIYQDKKSPQKSFVWGAVMNGESLRLLP